MSAHWKPLPQSLQCAGGTATAAADGDADGPVAGDDVVAAAAEAAGLDDGTVASQPATSAIVTRAARPPFARRRQVIRSGGYLSHLSLRS